MASKRVNTLADLGAGKASEHAGIQNSNAGHDYWAGIGQGQKPSGGNDTGSRETAGGNDTGGQKAKSIGHESGSEYNISGRVVGAGMVGVVTGGTNTVTNSAGTPGKKKAESSQEAVGGNAKDGQEAAGGNAPGGQNAVGRETGSKYNVCPQIYGAGIVGVVSGGTNTVEHSTVTEGEPIKDNRENDKSDQEAVGGNNTGGRKSVGENV